MRPARSARIRPVNRSSVVSVCVEKWGRWYEGELTIKRITTLFCIASTRSCAPSSPISLQCRPSLMSVCVEKWSCDMNENRRERGSQYYFLMHPPNIVLLWLRFDSRRDRVWWVSVWKVWNVETRENRRDRESPCYFVMHSPGTVLLCLRFDYDRDEVQ